MMVVKSLHFNASRLFDPVFPRTEGGVWGVGGLLRPFLSIGARVSYLWKPTSANVTKKKLNKDPVRHYVFKIITKYH